MTFAELGLSTKVLEAVASAGFSTPTPIQEQGIPPALQRKDVLGLAQTGSGKTAAFVLPMLTMLEQGRARARMPRTLILEPTRELAAQVQEAFETLGKNHRLTVALLIGGVSFDEQAAKIDRGADVVIATPGRLLDHFERGKLLLTGVEMLVIDEADRMLDMGFIPDIERICKLLPFTRQTLFFSATMPPEIQRLTGQFLHNPARVEVSPTSSTVSTIVQRLVRAPGDVKERRNVLRALLKAQSNVKNAIIFANRKTTVAVLETSLRKHGFNAAALHGDMDQSARLRTLAAFRANEITYLVASDVAARGLDIPDVSHIFNFDVPIHPEDYVHRIGRTGRAGREGFSFTLVSSHELKHLKAIEQLIKRQIEWAEGPAGVQWQPRAPAPHGEWKSEPRRESQKQPAQRHQPKPHKQPETQRRQPRPIHEPAEPARFNTSNLPAFLARPVRTA
jgi:superfamily II DNA/RNA helicase